MSKREERRVLLGTPRRNDALGERLRAFGPLAGGTPALPGNSRREPRSTRDSGRCSTIRRRVSAGARNATADRHLPKGLAMEEANAIHARIKDMRGRLDALRGYL